MANVAGAGGGSAYGRPRPTPKAPSRKTAIDKLVSQSFTATPQGNTLIAKRFKAMNLSPEELDYVKQSSATRGAAARKKANPLNTQVADMAQFGINPHVFKHPIARLEGKGEFAPSDVIGRNADGSPRYGYASMVPWFGGGESDALKAVHVPLPETGLASAGKIPAFPGGDSEAIRAVSAGSKPSALLGKNESIAEAHANGLLVKIIRIPGEHFLYRLSARDPVALKKLEHAVHLDLSTGEMETAQGAAAIGRALGYSEPDIAAYIAHNNLRSDPTLLLHEGAPKPHPLTAGKPTIMKGPQPTVKTLGQTATEGLTGAKGLRATQEKLRNLERGSRAREYAKELQANPTMAGHQRASQLLAGELPKMKFGGFQDFTPETLDAMTKAVVDHPDLQPFTQKRAIDALGKIHAGKVPTKGEEKILRQVFGPEVVKELKQAVSKFHQVKSIAYDVGNLPRSVMASFDASGVLRQALLVATGHPVVWAKNVPSYLKAIKSEDVYKVGMEALHSRPNAVNGVYEKMGIDLTELTPRGQAAAREESFRSPLAEKIPGIRMSGRGFTLFLDNARADLADLMYAKAIKQGRDVNDSHLLESIGDVVNSSSGRGDLGQGAIGKSQEGLNLLLFSPRLIKSRIDFLNPVWYARLDPLARHEAYKAMGGLAVLMLATLSIAKAAGATVNLDPRSSDFAKIKMGNTRLDLAGGFQQYIRLLSELATQSTVSTATGQTTHLGRIGPGKTSDFDLLFRFFRSKLAPIASAGVDVSQRQNTVGQPITWQNQIGSRFTPLSGQDALSVGRDAANSTGSSLAGVAAGVGAFGLSAFGGGVQNYKPKPPAASRKKPRDYGGGGSSSRSPYGRSTSGGSVYGKRP